MGTMPASYRRLSLNQRLAWLNEPGCPLPYSQIQSERKRLAKLRCSVRRICASAALADEVEASGRPFPPPAETTPMEHPRIYFDGSEALQWFPCHYLSWDGATYDVVVFETERRRAEMELGPERSDTVSDPRSGSVGEDPPCPLLTEDSAVLQAQIDRYLAGKPTSLTADLDARPTCPECGIPMVRRGYSGGYFWGCANYPECRFTTNGTK